MKTTSQTILKIAMLLCAAASVRATTLARLSVDELAAAADAAARIRCTGAQSRWENGQIWTVTSFDVVETVKGTLPANCCPAARRARRALDCDRRRHAEIQSRR
jgi:hypothetical protein